uniref:Uncharacterized protein n=1 Tax=Physcomitrium patens TaxID=3218 RepID=A0A7I4BI30_PHYPA
MKAGWEERELPRHLTYRPMRTVIVAHRQGREISYHLTDTSPGTSHPSPCENHISGASTLQSPTFHVENDSDSRKFFQYIQKHVDPLVVVHLACGGVSREALSLLCPLRKGWAGFPPGAGPKHGTGRAVRGFQQTRDGSYGGCVDCVEEDLSCLDEDD